MSHTEDITEGIDDVAIRPALHELARTIGDEPTTLEGLDRRVAGMRRRRRAARATIAVGICAVAVAGLAAVTGRSSDTTSPAAAPDTAPSAAPDCSASAHPADAAPVDSAALAAKRATAELGQTTGGAGEGASVTGDSKVGSTTPPAADQNDAAAAGRVKLGGTIAGQPVGDTIVVHVEHSTNSAEVGTDVSLSLAPDTQYLQGGQVVSRSVLNDRDSVALSARTEAGGYVVDKIETGIQPESQTGQKTGAPTPPAGTITEAKGIAKVVDKVGSVVSLTFGGGPLDGTTLTADLATVKAAHTDGQPCDAVALEVGDTVGVIVETPLGGAPSVIALSFP